MILIKMVLGQNLQIVEDSVIVEPQDEPEKEPDESSGVVDEVINTEETSLNDKD